MNRVSIIAVAVCCLAVAPEEDPAPSDARFVVTPGDPTGLRKPKSACREDSKFVEVPDLKPPYDRATRVDGCTRERAFRKGDLTRIESWRWERVDGSWRAFTTHVFESHPGWSLEQYGAHVSVTEYDDAGVWLRRTGRFAGETGIWQSVDTHHLDGGERFDVRQEEWADGGWRVLDEFESGPCHYRPIEPIIQSK